MLEKNRDGIRKLSRAGVVDQDIYLSLQNLVESIKRLDIKISYYRDSVKAMRGIMSKNSEMTAPAGKSTASLAFKVNDYGTATTIAAGHIPEESHRLQFVLAASIEEVFQQTYVVLSRLGQLMRYLKVPNYEKSTLPIRSNAKLIKALESVYPDDKEFIEALDYLESARKYRSEYIDHYQSNSQVDWMTTDPGDDIYICYFVPESNKIFYRAPRHPLSPDFVPPNDFKSFIVSPSVSNTMKALIDTTKRLLVE